MPWQPDHKQRTRRRIVEAAAAAFREHGIAGVGIADIMRRAALTHGAFYSHFKSKDALLAEAQALIDADNRARAARVAGRVGNEKLIAVADAYLSSRHRQHPEHGCSIATLGSELVRAGGPPRHSLDANIRLRLDQLSGFAPARGARRRRQQAAGTYAAMIGGMILARGVEDPHAGDSILADVRAFLRDALNSDKAA